MTFLWREEFSRTPPRIILSRNTAPTRQEPQATRGKGEKRKRKGSEQKEGLRPVKNAPAQIHHPSGRLSAVRPKCQCSGEKGTRLQVKVLKRMGSRGWLQVHAGVSLELVQLPNRASDTCFRTSDERLWAHDAGMTSPKHNTKKREASHCLSPALFVSPFRFFNSFNTTICITVATGGCSSHCAFASRCPGVQRNPTAQTRRDWTGRISGITSHHSRDFKAHLQAHMRTLSNGMGVPPALQWRASPLDSRWLTMDCFKSSLFARLISSCQRASSHASHVAEKEKEEERSLTFCALIVSVTVVTTAAARRRRKEGAQSLTGKEEKKKGVY